MAGPVRHRRDRRLGGPAAPWAPAGHRSTFTSAPDLINTIRTFIDAYNERCQPFVWTKTADQILTKTNRQRSSDTRHWQPSPSPALGAG
ncbi:hypothetical protein ACH4T9_18035 [Micromonospora sp. NPDC020750]|uniref:hypothetical protein n=1 Tax=unclassified Micromonospora TaxID=2617518 RepID=UPI0037A40A5A